MYGRQFDLNDIRQKLLTRHRHIMRLHTDAEIEAMSKADMLEIMKRGAVIAYLLLNINQ